MKKNLGNFLKEKRLNSGLSQKRVAEKLGYTCPQFISNWERGISHPPLKTIKKIVALYSVSIDEVYNAMLQEIIYQKTEELKKIFKKSI